MKRYPFLCIVENVWENFPRVCRPKDTPSNRLVSQTMVMPLSGAIGTTALLANYNYQNQKKINLKHAVVVNVTRKEW